MAGHVLLASYLKSGNTWLRLLLDSLVRGGDEVDINSIETSPGITTRDQFDRAMMMDSADLTEEEIACARPAMMAMITQGRADGALPVFFKAHEANLPWPGTAAWVFTPDTVARVVHMVRDPRDVAVSLASHLNKSVDEAIARMEDPLHIVARQGRRLAEQLPQYVSSWSGHTVSWLDAVGFVRITIRYEDLLAETPACFLRVAEFLGLQTEAAAIQRAVDATRFERLRGQEAETGFRERPLAMARFFRSGTAGGWRNSLSASQAERIVSTHGALMRRLGYLP